MHHYGEMHFKVGISGDEFEIILFNHITGAQITVHGPLEGVFEDKMRRIDQEGVENLGREIAHVFRKVLR